ncbi:junctional adhesion molecule B isoform X1 [Zootoca vivipara]|uniref:junctional adhesion molecule B isoform X1 n=1 Tax=Zootoca vivipara TaxID=8524 RepID=UPI00293BDA4C|nr:junctional adhesion molecule B isoform X1 [Zootoca vivipara]
MASRRVFWLLFWHLGFLGYYKAYGIVVETDTKDVTANEFEEAFLSCKHNEGKETTRVEWKKITKTGVIFVYFKGSFVGDFKNRGEIVQSSIRIKNVTRKDSGKYRCEISASTEHGQQIGEVIVSLLVLVPPAPPACEVPSSAMTGTVVELRCKENNGVPASKYRWYRNGVLLPESPALQSIKKERLPYIMNATTGTLLFNSVSKNDTGEYYCEADNNVGQPQKCSVKRMQVDDLNVGGIIAAVVIVALIIASCGLGVYYAQKKGYFSTGRAKLQIVKRISSTPSHLLFKRNPPSEEHQMSICWSRISKGCLDSII